MNFKKFRQQFQRAFSFFRPEPHVSAHVPSLLLFRYNDETHNPLSLIARDSGFSQSPVPNSNITSLDHYKELFDIEEEFFSELCNAIMSVSSHHGSQYIRNDIISTVSEIHGEDAIPKSWLSGGIKSGGDWTKVLGVGTMTEEEYIKRVSDIFDVDESILRVQKTNEVGEYVDIDLISVSSGSDEDCSMSFVPKKKTYKYTWDSIREFWSDLHSSYIGEDQ